jgi:phosphatidylglycerophosphatase A
MENPLIQAGGGTAISDKHEFNLQPLLANPTHLLALGLGSGLSPKAPGTAGSLLALLLAIPVVMLAGVWGLVFLAVLATLTGSAICGYTSAALGGEDHKAIVWDEFAGMWIVLVAVPAAPLWWIAAFVLFRLFDILKPWPIGWADRQVKGGLGIMLDDVIAGLLAALLLLLLQYLAF